jgi:alpha/beta superfamily hydrolase
VARRIESVTLPGPAGDLEALLEEPEDRDPGYAALVCHPHPLYGGTMHNKVVYRLARGLRRSGAVVLRFNFRGVGRSAGEHGHLEGEIEDARTALDWLVARYPGLSYALAGFSFGSRVVTRLACELGTPRFVMAAGSPTRWGVPAHLSSCQVPKIFIQSTNDEYGPRADFDAMYAGFAEPKQLHWIEAADHFFVGSLDALEVTVASSAASVSS